ncbi:MAG TPA: PIG-L family deacetylase [Dehalococcoidia bacterium]|nr:PIG-L family deacetylase [Dehalococcoidia bacterium]
MESNEPILVISPHLDDGVFSCGDRLLEHPGSTAVTVFAGVPDSYGRLSSWDEASGFAAGNDVIAARRREDEAALALLGARPRWLRFLDAQYEATPCFEEVVVELRDIIADIEPAAVLSPLGLFHSDHALASRAALDVARSSLELRWFVYADAIYRCIDNLLEQRLTALRGEGWRLTRCGERGRATETKRRAIEAYASQLRALALPPHPGYRDAFEPECYWLLEPLGGS